MSRLLKKCLIGSSGLHLLLVLGLLVTAGFKSAPGKTETVQLLTFIPLKAVDAPNVSGGGNPAPAPAPQKQAPSQKVEEPPPQKQVEQSKPEPVQPAKEPDPEPEPEPVKNTAINFDPVVKKTKTPPRKLTEKVTERTTSKPTTKTSKISLDKPTTRTLTSPNSQVSKTTAEPTSRQTTRSGNGTSTAQAFNKAANNILSGSAKSTVFDVPGQGGSGGGEAYADYRSIVYTTYYNAWLSPDEVADDLATAEARIVIARDGSVISYSLQKRSGKTILDKSVENALGRVRKLPPLPFNDAQRTFIIRFNLKAKQSLG